MKRARARKSGAAAMPARHHPVRWLTAGRAHPRFSACSSLEHGFARTRCDACAHEYLLALSCKHPGAARRARRCPLGARRPYERLAATRAEPEHPS